MPENHSEDTRPKAAAEGALGFDSGTSPSDSSDDADALNAAAERLAGMDAADGEEIWARHAKEMDVLWSEIESRRLAAMRDWSSSVLAPLLPAPELALFYPFGGPDFLSSFLFFPEAPSHILIGLQPPGKIPELDEIEASALESELARLRSGFESLVEAGYFQQTDMDRDLDSERLDGILPVLYIFLVRTGHRPVAVRHVAFDAAGEIIAPGETANAVVVEYVAPGEDDVRTLLYVAQDLSDEGLAASPEFVRYLEQQAPWNVFMKGAVYLLHMDGFSSLANLLLKSSRTVLQTDSGLPLRAFEPADWDLRFFGAYTRTLPVYSEYFQEDLRNIFTSVASGEAKGGRDSPEITSLGFAIGYHAQIGEGCLILAHRKSVP